MSERKNINKLFQEKFENFEVTPDKMVWTNIESKLKEKKKRRVIPFWWKLSGIAAALLISFFVNNNDSKPLLNIENSVANHEKDNAKTNSNSVNKTSDKTKNGIELNDVNHKNTIEVNTNKNDVQSIAVSNNNTKTKSSLQENKAVEFKITKNNQIVNNVNKPIKNKVNTTSIVKNNSEERIVFQSSKHKKTRPIKSSDASENENYLAVKLDTKEKSTSINDVTNSNKESNISIANNNTRDKNKSVLTPDNTTDEIINKKNDSIKIANVEPNALEELLKEKESKQITEPKLNRWQVSSNVAPIYFSSLSKGSPIDDKLANNDKAYSANNQSYGVGVNYSLNKKLKVRTGVNVLNVDYNTNGIVYYQTQSVSGKLSNLNPNIAGNTIIIENLSNVNTPFNKIVQKSEGNLNQKLGYIEMPLELTYKILDKKLGIDFIGGMSTMLLNRNEIYLQSSDLNLKIGEANNLNNVHFSGNLGLGFKYGLFKHLDARIEPVFKYQINTFSNDSGNFKPYMFGVYSGINFTF
jgi:Outer membrane protein beta-barrel domain